MAARAISSMGQRTIYHLDVEDKESYKIAILIFEEAFQEKLPQLSLDNDSIPLTFLCLDGKDGLGSFVLGNSRNSRGLASLRMIGVVPQRQREGVGRYMLSAAEKYASEQKFRGIYTNPADRLIAKWYKKAGYKVYERKGRSVLMQKFFP